MTETMPATRAPESVLDFAEKNFRPAAVEKALYAWWEDSHLFSPSGASGREAFTIILPPPNVTGDLHIGHGYTFTLEDILVRWHRMLGDPTLFLPGSDHSGIAAQIVVERELDRQGIDRMKLGRDGFLREMWKWMEFYKPRMYGQMRAMGWSLDWDRVSFTMDPDKQRAVRTHFIRLYKDGHLYRADRIVHWCVRCQSTYSDLELLYRDRADTLWYVRYPFADGAPGGIEIATTRPETIVADAAVAVHPDDARWKPLLGRDVLVPVVERRVKIIADEAVDPAFGTGAVKVTPGHDQTDWEIGQRHHLPIISVIDTRGMMTPASGPLAGLDRDSARTEMVQRLRKAGLLVKEEPLQHAVGYHDRCGTTDEPLTLKQWWCAMARLAPPALEAVRDGRVRIIPPHFEKTYVHWMENIRDWSIARQIWWGHEIPVWYCRDCQEVIVPDEEAPDPTRCPKCASDDLRKEDDVLDTWFSSALWPHSTLGWPDRTADLARFYPTSVLNTAYEILLLWVARMIMMGLRNMGDVPFGTVYVNGIVRVGTEKMSKSKGNVVNPIQLVNDYGADAARYGLINGVAPGADSRISPVKMDRARNFVNKIWNAGRFALAQADAHRDAARRIDPTRRPAGALSLADRWILARTDAVIAQAEALLGRFDVGEYASMLERYFWGELADWYLEAAKGRLREGNPATLATLLHVFDRALRLMHPVMPFVTETLAQQLWARSAPAEGAASLMVSAWPTPGQGDAEAEERFGLLADVVRVIRTLRQEQGVAANATVDALADGGRDVLEPERELVERLAGCRLAFGAGAGAAAVVRGVTVRVRLPDVDRAAVRERLASQLAEAREMVRRSEELLARDSFTAKAPADIVAKERERLEERRAQARKLEDDLAGA